MKTNKQPKTKKTKPEKTTADSPQSAAPLVRCGYSGCNKQMTPGRFGTRRFCTNAHRQAAYRERNKKQRGK